MDNRIYIAIDLKSFYASVECVERNLDPLNTNLVVADSTRTEKTICLAVSPSLKAYGLSGRSRLFEVVEKVKMVNAGRILSATNREFTGESYFDDELKSNKDLSLGYIVAPPRMAYYMMYSTKIYDIYLKYIAPEDIHVYSIDEVFMDVTGYLKTYKMDARALAMTIIHDVLKSTGITATAGIGTNMYLCKIAMDIVAKHVPADADGVRIAQLDEMSYRRLLWEHRPLTDFWRIGRGYSKKLEGHGLMTMGDIARCSIGKSNEFYNEDLLYKMFGVNAELLIDHAWGWENVTISDIKGYRPQSNSLSTGQVLTSPYTFDMARLIVSEMIELLSLDLVDKGLMTDQMTLTIGYDIDNLKNSQISEKYTGDVKLDVYGRSVPKHGHGSINIGEYTSSTKLMSKKILELYDKVANKLLLVRRINISANRLMGEGSEPNKKEFQQLDLFSDYSEIEKEKKLLEKEKSRQRAIINIKKKYGKNAVFKGMNLCRGATSRERNGQIGGHKA